MAERGASSALAGVLVALVAVVVFPIQWVRAYRMAKDHREDDPRGPVKVLAGIVVGVLLAGAGAAGLGAVQDGFVDGTYATLDERIQQTVLEQEYQDSLATIEQKDAQIPIIQENLDARFAEVEVALETSLAVAPQDLLQNLTAQWEAHKVLTDQLVSAARGQGDLAAARDLYGLESERVEMLLETWTEATEAAQPPDERVAELDSTIGAAVSLPAVLAQAYEDQDDARARAQELEEHHRLYLSIEDEIVDKDDDAVRQAIAGFTSPSEGDAIDLDRLDALFDRKDDAIQDMYGFFLWWPIWGWFSLLGLLFAPVVWAQGSILHATWRPSESVGYKRYPSFAMASFLFLGAFNVLALPFAAWTFYDMDVRSREGQIAL